MSRRIVVSTSGVPRRVTPPASAATVAGVDSDAIHDNVSGEINAISAKATPTTSDLLLIEDAAASNAKKKITIGDLPSGSVSPLTTKGDLYTYDTADARLAVGSDGQVLVADSAESLGVKWGDITSGVGGFRGVGLTHSTTQSISNNTLTTLTFNTENYDSDSFHSTGTNPERITIPTGLGGKYLVTAAAQFASDSTGRRYIIIRKNGSTNVLPGTILTPNSTGSSLVVQAGVVDLAAGDYIEARVYQDSGGSLNVENGTAHPQFQAYLIQNVPTWQDYTPTWDADSSSPSIGNGTIEGRYVQHGDIVHAQIELTIGSTTTLGSGTWFFTLPVTALTGASKRLGTALCVDSGSGFIAGICKPRSTTTIGAIIVDPTDSDAYTPEAHASYPISWATGDQLNMSITYEAA